MEVDAETSGWRCAYYAYLDSERSLDEAEEDAVIEEAAASLRETVDGFLEARLNFGTLKYRMDNAAVESGSVFPPRSVGAALSDLALGVQVDDLEPALRRAARLPEDLGEAKGLLMDFEDAMEVEVSRGLQRTQARPERWVELMSCLWHIQDPLGWPLIDRSALEILRKRGEVDMSEPSHGYAEYVGALRHLAEVTGGSVVAMTRLLAALEDGAVTVPSEEACFESAMARARELDGAGTIDRALDMYERALSLRPGTEEALLRKAVLYEAKGLTMAAIGELETLVEMAPRDVQAHRRLVALYRAQNMIREHNVEVRRFKALREGAGRPS